MALFHKFLNGLSSKSRIKNESRQKVQLLFLNSLKLILGTSLTIVTSLWLKKNVLISTKSSLSFS